MTLPVFVVDADALGAEVIELDGDEGHHAVVTRIKPGQRVMLTDTHGNGAECVVKSVSRHGLVADVVVRRSEPVGVPRLVVVQAIPKGDHAERAVTLLTEVGVDEVVPWAASRAIVTWKGERAAKARSRWQAAARVAAKQSRRLRFPVVAGVRTTREVADLIEGADLALVLHEAARQPMGAVAIPAEGEIVLVVGPEGGVSDEELTAFTSRGAVAVRLSPSVLRSSTAGVVGAAAVLSRTSRWA